MSTDTKETTASEEENTNFLTMLRDTIVPTIKKYHSLARINLAQKLIAPYLPEIVKPHLASLTTQIKSITSAKLPSISSSITEDDVVLAVLSLHLQPILFLLVRHTDILPFMAEVYCTLLYPLKKTLAAIEQRRHDTSGHLLSFWVLLSSLHIIDNLFGLRYYFPRSYLPLKCIVSYCMVNSKRQWILVWDAVVTYVYILPKLGLSDGRSHRAALMKKELEEKDDAALEKKIEAKTTTTDAQKKEEKTRDDSPASNATSEFSYVDLAELESKQQAGLVSVTLTVKDMTAEKLMVFDSKEKDVESPYLVFDIVDSKDVGHAEDGKGKKYKTLEGSLVEEEEEEEVKEPELVAEEEEEKDTAEEKAEGERNEEVTATEGDETEKDDDKKEETTDTTTATETPESPKEEPEKKKSTSFAWEGQVISIHTKIRSSEKKNEDSKEGETKTTTSPSPEDATSSYLRIMAFEKCTIGNDTFVGMSHLEIADLAANEEAKAYQVSLKNEKASEDLKSGEVSMSVSCARE